MIKSIISICYKLFLLCTVLIALPAAQASAAGQESETRQGIIDHRATIEHQIAELEARLFGHFDLPAERQAAYHLWLIELYDSTGRSDDVIRSYEKIVSLFPYDVGILNRYARFMLERRKDRDSAELLISQARKYSGLIEVTDVDRGTTLYLQASIDLDRNRYQNAISGFITAAFLCEEDPGMNYAALSGLTQALSLTGRYREAVDTYLGLLGKKERYGPEEMDRLKNLMNLAGTSRTGDPERMIADAVERERLKRKERIEREGASLVSLALNNGAMLEGTIYDGLHPGAVLYLAPPDGTRLVFRLFSQLLFTEGINVLSLDLRHAGESRASNGAETDSSENGPIQDAVAAAVSFLQEKYALNEEQITIVSEGSVCEMVELALSQHRLSCPVLYLSPLFDRTSRRFAGTVPFRPVQPLLIIYSVEDRAALLSLEHFKELSVLPKLEVMKLENAGHGIELLKRSPQALAAFLSWIKGVLKVPQ